MNIKFIIILLYLPYLLSIDFNTVLPSIFFTKIISEISYFHFLKFETNSQE
ncbi:MAG: hypothetical protein Q8S84_05460 [bacterium]|nr:hypothetical protein [bacterium]MDP3380938.1 hypothetical protein [bacterium]